LRKKAPGKELDFEIFDNEDANPKPKPAAGRLFGKGRTTRLGVAGLAVLTGAIAVNALLLQDQRHAAPLFETNLRTPAVAVIDPEPPRPAPRPADLAVAPVARQPVAKAEPPRVDPAAKSEAARSDSIAKADGLKGEAARLEASRAEQHRDLIAREIGRNETASIRVDKSDKKKQTAERKPDPIGGLMRSVGIEAQPAQDPKPSVMAAQRALMKLGFVVRPDGVFGDTTRQAIERFARDNRLPARGDLTPQVKRELARLSGVQVD